MKEIGILDDVELEGVHIKNKIEDYCTTNEYDVNCTVFTDADTLKNYLASGERLDIVFLDIELNSNETGIDVAQWINGKVKTTQVVFLTGYLEYATEVYETQHCYYVLKEELSERLPQVFAQIDNKARYEKIMLPISGKTYIYRQDEIMYAERSLRITKIHLLNGQIVKVNMTISELEEQFNPYQFIRCHNSLLVNFETVREMTRTHLKLMDGRELSISRRYSDNVRQKSSEWARRR